MNALAPPDFSPAPRRAWREVSGILLLDKPVGLSSNQALQRVRRLLGAARGGHTGSLDPLATGMLPLCLGEATKFSGFLLDSGKVYRTRMALGRRTTTGDAEGPVVETGADSLPAGSLESALERFRGTIEQIPPMFSALKQDGQPLYRLARKGVSVERPPRTVVIHRLEWVGTDDGDPVLEVSCSKGTYIRTLVEDIARAAGTVAHVRQLRRLSVNPFREAQMIDLPALERVVQTSPEAGDGLLLPVDAALVDLPLLRLDEADTARLRQGRSLTRAGTPVAGAIRLYGPAGEFLGLGEYQDEAQLRPRRLMATASAAVAEITLNRSG